MIDDTILAISTPLGPAPLAVLRLSGPDAVAHAARRLTGFVECTGGSLQEVVFDWDGVFVDVRATVFRGPRSYTGEDMVELTVPGSMPFLAVLMRAFLASNGAGLEAPRPARPGEFTLRAFLNGKMDLAQAEAVGRLIHASGDVEARAAYRQIGGALGHRIDDLADGITRTLALVEAAIDFPDEEIPEIAATTLGKRIDSIGGEVGELMSHSALRVPDRGNVKIAVLGLPNAGKSSLVNAAVGRSLALVSGLAGTTRDPVRGFSEHAGRQLEWVDLAGLEASSWTLGGDDPDAEDASFPLREAIQRLSRHELETADVILWVLDGEEATRDFDAGLRELESLAEPLRARALVVVSKIDLLEPEHVRALEDHSIRPGALSSHTGVGFGALLDRIVAHPESVDVPRDPTGDTGEFFLLSPLQHTCLSRCREALENARLAVVSLDTRSDGGDFELAAVDLRDALLALDPVVGREISERVLSTIFGQFCVGK
jgi:tRNA modification GTPase